MDTNDWRATLPPDSRQRIVHKVMETLKRHLPFSGQDGLQELEEIAVRFEEKIYNDATSQSDYLRKISLEILTMESKSQHTIYGSANERKSPDQGASHSMQPEVHMLADYSEAHQHLLSQKLQNMTLTGVENSAGLQSAMTSVTGLTQTSIPNAPGLSSTVHNIAIVPKNTVTNSMAQYLPANMDNGDWRAQLQPDSRQRIANKILETLKRLIPFSGQELKKIAVRFEEKIYAAATSQSDYLRKISLKMLTMESKSNPNPQWLTMLEPIHHTKEVVTLALA